MMPKQWKLSFVSASMDDVPLIFAQSKALVDAYEDVASIPYEQVMNWMHNKIQENIAQYTKVCIDGITAGFYRLVSGEEETELDDFYILPPFRGQGIGTAVLEKCILDEQKPMFLYVFQKNVGAIRLYNRFGFEPAQVVSETRMILRRKG